MGNQPSTAKASSPSHHRRTSSARYHPHGRRLYPNPSGRRGESDGSDPWIAPGTGNLPRTPHLRPHFSLPSSPLTTSSSPSAPEPDVDVDSNPSAGALSSAGRGLSTHSRAMGNSQSNEQWPEREPRRRDRRAGGGASVGYDAHSSPMQVPVGGSHSAHHQQHSRDPSAPYDQRDAAPPVGSDDYALKSNLNFPPRLPLPIQEEVYTPGSPIITPDDLSRALREDEEDAMLPTRTSLLSHTTADEEEDAAEYGSEANHGRTVPTVIRWRGDAERVYITGSFAAWARKFRMHRDLHDPRLLATKLDLLPGTHHVKFIVDGDMQLSDELPTAVDYTNILVNYIEVSADDIPHDESPGQPPPQGLHPPLVHPPGVEKHDFAPQPTKDETPSKDPTATATTDAAEKRYISTTGIHYSDKVPQYLPDLDCDESTNRFRRSANHIADIPQPPSLPMFLGKSILNGTTPMKDDSSVLNMPNHTVLNHLATSSIKNDVLATSLTTRYRRKYVTTITYRPTKEED